MSIKKIKRAMIEDENKALELMMENLNFNFENNWALKTAAKFGYIEMIKLIHKFNLSQGVNSKSAWKEALYLAVENTSLNVIIYICETVNIDASAACGDCLLPAIKYGDLDIIKYLCELPIEKEFNPAYSNNFIIRTASQYGQLKIIKYLCELPIERWIDPSAHYNETFLNAVDNGHLDVVKYLCELSHSFLVKYLDFKFVLALILLFTGSFFSSKNSCIFIFIYYCYLFANMVFCIRLS